MRDIKEDTVQLKISSKIYRQLKRRAKNQHKSIEELAELLLFEKMRPVKKEKLKAVEKLADFQIEIGEYEEIEIEIEHGILNE